MNECLGETVDRSSTLPGRNGCRTTTQRCSVGKLSVAYMKNYPTSTRHLLILRFPVNSTKIVLGA